MSYELRRMPTEKEALQQELVEYTPFLDAMYTPEDEAVFGPVNFVLDHWLFLWDKGAGYFVTKRDDRGQLTMLAMITQFNDMWHGRGRIDIHRMAVNDEVATDDIQAKKEITDLIDYLKSNASLLKFDMIYYVARDTQGNEIKELVWKR